jgi:hypothetical protein
MIFCHTFSGIYYHPPNPEGPPVPPKVDLWSRIVHKFTVVPRNSTLEKVWVRGVVQDLPCTIPSIYTANSVHCPGAGWALGLAASTEHALGGAVRLV